MDRRHGGITSLIDNDHTGHTLMVLHDVITIGVGLAFSVKANGYALPGR